MFVTLCTFWVSPHIHTWVQGPLAICFFVVVVVVVVIVVVGGPVAKACDVSLFMFSHVHSQSATSGD